MTLILGSAYQSLVISLISESRNGKRLNTFDELMQSDLNIITDPLFFQSIVESPEYVFHARKIQKDYTSIDELDFVKLAKENTAIIMACSVAKFVYSLKINRISEMFYELPDERFHEYYSFLMSKNSFFKRMSLRVFESGIKQHWKRMYPINDFRNSNTTNLNNNEKYLLNLQYIIIWLYAIWYSFKFNRENNLN